MISTGQRSYHDDYMRKKGTGRVIADPSALLTDRNAYVNFLEVQLERVSAACLAVQSVEERFNDVTNMIKTVEQRCTANIKLIGLSQQCTEEVRAESDRKYESLAKQIQEDRWATERATQLLSHQLAQAERKISHLEQVEAQYQVTKSEFASLLVEHAQSKEQIRLLQKENQQLRAQLSDFAEDTKSNHDTMLLNMTQYQRQLQSSLDEHLLEQSRSHQSTCDRFQQYFETHKAETIAIQELQEKRLGGHVKEQNDRLESIQLDLLQRLQRNYESIEQQIVLLRDNVREEIAATIPSALESSADIQESIAKLVQVRAAAYEMAMEEKVAQRSQQILDEYVSLMMRDAASEDVFEYEDDIEYEGDSAFQNVTGEASRLVDDDNMVVEGTAASSLNTSVQSQRSNLSSSAKRSATALSQLLLQRVSSTTSMMTNDQISQQQLQQDGAFGRVSRNQSFTRAPLYSQQQDISEINHAVQALLDMHRKDIASIHQRLDVMSPASTSATKAGVKSGTALSRRHSSASLSTNSNNNSTTSSGGTLKRKSSIKSTDKVADTSFYSLTSSSSQQPTAASSSDGLKAVKANKETSSSSLKKRGSVASLMETAPEDSSRSAKSLQKTSSTRSVSRDASSTEAAATTTATNDPPLKSALSKKRLSFASDREKGNDESLLQDKETRMGRKRSSKSIDKSNTGGLILDLSLGSNDDDDSIDSDYEDMVVEDYNNYLDDDLQGASSVSRKQSFTRKGSVSSISASIVKPTEASISRHKEGASQSSKGTSVTSRRKSLPSTISTSQRTIVAVPSTKASGSATAAAMRRASTGSTSAAATVGRSKPSRSTSLAPSSSSNLPRSAQPQPSHLHKHPHQHSHDLNVSMESAGSHPAGSGAQISTVLSRIWRYNNTYTPSQASQVRVKKLKHPTRLSTASATAPCSCTWNQFDFEGGGGVGRGIGGDVGEGDAYCRVCGRESSIYKSRSNAAERRPSTAGTSTTSTSLAK